MKSKMTSDLKSASIVRLRRMMHTPIERLAQWTDLVLSISKTTNGKSQLGDFVTMTNSEMRNGKNRNTGLCIPSADPEVDHEETSRQRIKTPGSTSTKLPGTDRVTPPLVTPLVDTGASIEEVLTNIVGSIGEHNEQLSLRMSELERAVLRERTPTGRDQLQQTRS